MKLIFLEYYKFLEPFFGRDKKKVFLLSNPKKNDLVVFDAKGIEILKKTLIYNLDFSIIYTREGKYYLSLEIAIRTIINKLLNGCGFGIAYYLSLVQIMKPKVLITFYSRNSMGLLSKYYKAEYYSIQNGFHLPRDISKSEAYYTPNLFCFGKYDIDLYKQAGIEVDNFYSVGSLKAGYYKKNLAPKINNIKFDICLVSQYRPRIIESRSNHQEFKKAYDVMQKYLIQYLNNNQIRFVIAMARYRKGESNLERSYYENIYGNKAIMIKNNPEEFSTYFTMDQSDIVISLNSTAAFEALGWGKKTFIFSVSGSLDLTLNRTCSQHFVMCENSYQEFEKKIDGLRKMTSSKYSKLVYEDKSYFMNHDPAAPAHQVIREKINSAIYKN